MKLPEIITVPNPILRQKLEPVTEFNQSLVDLSEVMLEVMRQANGVGLAANQVGELARMFVYGVDEPFEADGRVVQPIAAQAIINPVITVLTGDSDVDEEGCLSIPHLYGPVERPLVIRLQAQDINGAPIDRQIDGYEARIVQHETDHLNGILFLDKLTDPTKLRKA